MKYLGIDTETGGLYPAKNPLLSVGMVITDKLFRIQHRYEINIKGNSKFCERKALEVNGIDIKKHNKGALTPFQALKEIKGIIKNHFGEAPPRLIGHNIHFDIRFMEMLYMKFGGRYPKPFKYHYHLIDTMSAAGVLKSIGLVRSMGLNPLLKQFGIKSVGRAHTALVDIENTVKLLRYFKKNITITP